MTKIGVFDSGIGGKSVANRLKQLFPGTDIVFLNDSQNVPYGTKTRSQIISLTVDAVQPLLEQKCDAIVIACNTATTNAIAELRTKFPETHFIGLEPMIKPASLLTQTKSIAILATPSTLSSSRYRQLKTDWTNGIQVIEPDCSTWASLIEHDRTDEIKLDAIINSLQQANVDVIILGCTHYHWLKPQIQNITEGNVLILEPSDAIGARLNSLLNLNSELPQ